MHKSVALLSVLLWAACCVGAEEHKLIAMSEWSKPAGRLHVNSFAEQDFFQIVVVPTGVEAFVLDADF
jgi:hypothetical protein